MRVLRFDAWTKYLPSSRVYLHCGRQETPDHQTGRLHHRRDSRISFTSGSPAERKWKSESQYAYWMMSLHPEWTVLNRGINGQRTDQILARFSRDVLANSPNYVIVLADQGRSQDAIRKNLSSMYDLARKNKIRTVAATILPYNYASKEESERIRGLNEWILQAANRLGLLFCDTNAAVADVSDRFKLTFTPDGLHPDIAGYRRMGERPLLE